MALLTQPFLGGLLNVTFLGYPYYIYLIGLAILVSVFGHFVLWWLWEKPFESMWGLYLAYKDQINGVFIGDIKNRLELIPENKAKLIHPHEEYLPLYDDFFAKRYPCPRIKIGDIPYIGNVAKWVLIVIGYGVSILFGVIVGTVNVLAGFIMLCIMAGAWYCLSPDGDYLTIPVNIETLGVAVGRRFGRNFDIMIARTLEPDLKEAPMVTAGNIPIDMIYDFKRWTLLDAPARGKIKEITDIWNEKNPNDEIYTFEKFYRYASENMFGTLPPEIDLYQRIPWVRIKASFPREDDETKFAGYERQRALDFENADADKMDKMFWGILILFGLIDMSMIAAWLMGFVGHH
jgi:hypothetical protein